MYGTLVIINNCIRGCIFFILISVILLFCCFPHHCISDLLNLSKNIVIFLLKWLSELSQDLSDPVSRAGDGMLTSLWPDGLKAIEESPAGTHLWLGPITDVAEVLSGMTRGRCVSRLTWTVAVEDQVCSILWSITSPRDGMPDSYSNRFAFKSFQISRWCCTYKLPATWWARVLERTSTASARMPPESP